MSELTLEDIARRAGVSRSTVSRVINHQLNVSESARQRVLSVIKDTGYHPNEAARALASRHSRMIGLVLPRSVNSFFSDPYFPRLIQGIAQACNQYDYSLGLFLVTTKEDEENIYPRVSCSGLLDGILVQAGQIGDQLIERLLHSSIPLVIIGRPHPDADVSYIDVNNVAAAYAAVNHLLQLGYRRIATIAGPQNIAVGLDRLEGYTQALLAYGLEREDSLIGRGEFTEESGYLAMQGMLNNHPEAVFAASDMMAIGAMRAAREANLRIPEDIAIIGFDDLPISATQGFNLSTVRQPVYRCGYKAVEILIDIIEHEINSPRRVIENTELVIRGTCGSTRIKNSGSISE